MALGRLKMRRWKAWERETRTAEYQFSHDPERFRFARETSFGRRHLSFWTKTPGLIWFICFFRQFVRSVPKVDYLTLRHGFITIILLVGTKLQVIISKMAIRIQQRGEVVKGVPVVQPGDDLFWFNRPRLILYLINFVLFQNAFQLAFFAWTWMGSTMKPTIFNERVATALRNWHHTAKKHIKQNRQSGFTTPMSSRPATPSHHLSPVHLLRHYRSEIDSSVQNTPRRSNFDFDHWGADTDGSPSPSHRHHRYGGGRGDGDGSSSNRHQQVEMGRMEDIESREVPQLEPSSSRVAPLPQHEIDIGVPNDFSFDKRTNPERFRFARETSFGRRHLSFWTKTPGLIWFICFFRQFVRSVPKVDYLTLRHGFITAHLGPQSHSRFDFQKYINRSLEEDFKVVVGISPPIWLFAVIFLLFNTHGWYSYYWLPFIPLIIILLVGTKLQVIISKMAIRIQQRGEVVKGVPVVQPGDDLFWFNRPRLILYLINFVLFQNAFQLAFFAWTWYEFGLTSCFHEHLEDIIIRVSMG
ncbi:hypothetical protein RHMOL_Rhmol01G0297400 [Rhododendron molle]|uniref:Uncharacterized protein n=1 Tax=Rhododendron molle TaxID=49168 RepID=A0ACC0Q787_RHOML|nr:hypothetical protein RHMOL_Rhmol01G0297400 [Rhododendron molle]